MVVRVMGNKQQASCSSLHRHEQQAYMKEEEDERRKEGPIHEPQCLKKWHAENEKLPKSKRRAAPVKPDAVVGDDGRIDAEATNEVLWKNSQGLMVECEHCGRKFNEDRLSVHQRSCTAENPAKSVGRSRSKSQPKR
uniref:C2H2-type domain-containing protein n=1 Tax=Caenorhabditis tropicalis TaxID=1561998 RepID=A0A1I7TZ39_9PELO